VTAVLAPGTALPYALVDFRAMASPCRIVTDDDELARAGAGLVHELEGRWSRFLPTSEVSAVNAAGGRPCVVSPSTVELFRRAELARRLTAGRFNPFVHDRLVALGGDAADDGGRAESDDPAPVPDVPIDVVPDTCLVRLPVGVRFDPGGIGKGLAADLVVEHLVALGARTVQVELGGDVRVHGPQWSGGSWHVDVADPHERSRRLTTLALGPDGGAVATSSVLGRSWVADGRARHHLIDPSTGLPSTTDVVAVTATSSETWWAEVVAKVAVLAGAVRAPATMRALGGAGVVLDRSGALRWVPHDGPVELVSVGGS
jgi:thiamine biosynthesis lipoprotein